MAWFATQGKKSADTVADVLVSHLQSSDERGNLASVLLAEPERIGLRREDLRSRLKNALSERSAYWGGPVLDALAVLCPESPEVVDAWQRFSEIIANARAKRITSPGQTYFAVAFAAADTNQIPELLDHCLEWLDAHHNRYYDDACTRHITHRLRRDDGAADMVQAAVMNPATPDSQAALLVSLLTQATGLEAAVLSEAKRRLAAQNTAILAPIVRDRTVGATLSVRTIFTRVSDTTWEMPPADPAVLSGLNIIESRSVPGCPKRSWTLTARRAPSGSFPAVAALTWQDHVTSAPTTSQTSSKPRSSTSTPTAPRADSSRSPLAATSQTHSKLGWERRRVDCGQGGVDRA